MSAGCPPEMGHGIECDLGLVNGSLNWTGIRDWNMGLGTQGITTLRSVLNGKYVDQINNGPFR